MIVLHVASLGITEQMCDAIDRQHESAEHYMRILKGYNECCNGE